MKQEQKETTMFMSVAELNSMLPWSKNIVAGMIRAGVFKPVRNPIAKGRSKMFFWRPQVEEAINAMVRNSLENEQKGGVPCA